MKTSPSLLALAVALIATSALADERRELSLAAAGLTSLDARVGAGSFVLEGQADATAIKVVADIHAPHDEIPEFTLEQMGNSASLVARFTDNRHHSGESPKIDITVYAPPTLALKLNDGSGSIHIQGMNADLDITDGSGSIHIDGAKAIRIDDGSGGIAISNTSDDVYIEDGSGSIDINHSAGDVIIKDGSGSIEVTAVMGRVEITDGSGSINVSNAGALLIHAAGSGAVSTADIRGEVIFH